MCCFHFTANLEDVNESLAVSQAINCIYLKEDWSVNFI